MLKSKSPSCLSFLLLLLLSKSILAAQCEPGSFRQDDSCTPCPPATFQSLSGQPSCVPCPANSTSPEGSTSCTPCGDLQIAVNNQCRCVQGSQFNLTDNRCEPCPRGTGYQVGDYRGRFPTGCVSCPPGYYQPLEGQIGCLQCPAGETSSRGATSCIACEPGTIPVDRETRCGLCPPGYEFDMYYLGGCEPCASGSYKPTAGQDDCIPCPVGLRSSVAASACGPLCAGGQLPLPDGTCETADCASGTALMSDGSCGRCAAGTFYNSTSLKCDECGVNTFSNCENLLGSCHKCAGNEYSTAGATACETCPIGMVLTKDGGCQRCAVGHYYDRDGLECKPCPANRYGPGGDQGENFLCFNCPEGTFARPGSGECFYCPFGEAYDGTADQCVSSCSVGEYYSHYEGRCRPCFGDSFKNVTGLQLCTQCPTAIGEAGHRRALQSNADRTACE